METIEQAQVIEQQPETVQENIQQAVEKTAPEFPSERFGGRFSSWEEVDSFLNTQQEPKYKDDFIKKVVEKYESDGTLEDFFKAYSTDWDKMDDIETLKKDFFEREIATGLDKKVVEKLWNNKLREYNVDPDSVDAEELEVNLAILARDANRVRGEMKKKQQEYLQPKTQSEQVDVNRVRKVVESLPETQRLKSDKKLVFDINGTPFNFAVDNVDNIVESLVDENVFRQVFISNNKVDADRYMKAMAFGANPDAMIKAFVDHGRTLGRQEIEKELKNPSQNQQQAPSMLDPKDMRENILNSFLESKQR